MNGVSLLNLPYNESLLLLQRTGKIVELIVSQILNKPQPPPKSVLNHSNNNNQRSKETSEQLLVRKQHQRNYMKNVDYLKHIRYETNEVNRMEAETKLIRLDAERDHHQCSVDNNGNSGGGYQLMAAKSMPDLPKVSGIYFFIG